ncbi:MAG: PTS sugar transporter subunit IIA [Planctomycetota bacterium]
MNLLDILSREAVIAPMKATEKKPAIDELVDAVAQTGKVADPDALREAVWTRERTRTTGIGHGLAIPHGKCPGLSGLAMAMGRPSEPMEFEAIDGQPVKLIVLLASPPDQTSDHIQALARISKLMNAETFREEIYAAPSAEEIYELIRRQEQPA